MRRFLLDVPESGPPEPGDLVVLDAEESHHLLDVLRGAEGRVWELVDGRGRRYTARAVGRRRKLAEMEILTVAADVHEGAEPHLVLACAVVKGRRFAWMLEKAVEVGVHRIIPLRTERGVVAPGAGRLGRWRGVLRTALKQSGRCLLPRLDGTMALPEALAEVGRGGVCFGALPDDADPADARSLIPDRGAPPPWLALFIGPEGGWSAGETATLVAAGAQPLDLGPHILRTETAAVVGLALLQSLRRDIGRAPGA